MQQFVVSLACRSALALPRVLHLQQAEPPRSRIISFAPAACSTAAVPSQSGCGICRSRRLLTLGLPRYFLGGCGICRSVSPHRRFIGAEISAGAAFLPLVLLAFLPVGAEVSASAAAPVRAGAPIGAGGAFPPLALLAFLPVGAPFGAASRRTLVSPTPSAFAILRFDTWAPRPR